MGVEDNDGRSQDSGLVRRKVWIITPFATHQVDIFEPAGLAPKQRSTLWELARERAIHEEAETQEEDGALTEEIIDQTPARDAILLGEEPRTLEG